LNCDGALIGFAYHFWHHDYFVNIYLDDHAPGCSFHFLVSSLVLIIFTVEVFNILGWFYVYEVVETLANMIAFQTSFLVTLLLTYKNFSWILIFFIFEFAKSTYQIQGLSNGIFRIFIISAIKNGFTSFIFVCFLFFSWLTGLTRKANTDFKKNEDSRHPWCIPDFIGSVSVFPHSLYCWLWVCHI
jgi:hypothetical protein